MRVLLFELILYVVCRVKEAHGNLKRILQTSMGYLYTCWDAINNLLVLQHYLIHVYIFSLISYIFFLPKSIKILE